MAVVSQPSTMEKLATKTLNAGELFSMSITSKLAASLVVLSAILSPSAYATQKPPTPVFAVNCGTLSIKPTTLTTSCPDSRININQITWDTWGKNGATGTGIYSANNCTPSCATGIWLSVPVFIKLAPPSMRNNQLVMNLLSISNKKDKPLPLFKKNTDIWTLQ